jgi:hypothetical protein
VRRILRSTVARPTGICPIGAASDLSSFTCIGHPSTMSDIGRPGCSVLYRSLHEPSEQCLPDVCSPLCVFPYRHETVRHTEPVSEGGLHLAMPPIKIRPPAVTIGPPRFSDGNDSQNLVTTILSDFFVQLPRAPLKSEHEASKPVTGHRPFAVTWPGIPTDN